MPIDRNDKHWCDPAAETPDGAGQFECPCGMVWVFWAEQSTWAPEGEDLTPPPAPEPDPEPVDPIAEEEL